MKTEQHKIIKELCCLSQALGQCWNLSQLTPMNLSWCTPSNIMWCSQVPLTPVFPRHCTSQQVHSPLHLQEEALPTRAAKQSEYPEERKPKRSAAT